MASSVATAMYPSPPIWMSPRMTSSPNNDQVVAVSTTTSPVTHTAEVAVNSNARYGYVVVGPFGVDNGGGICGSPTDFLP